VTPVNYPPIVDNTAHPNLIFQSSKLANPPPSIYIYSQNAQREKTSYNERHGRLAFVSATVHSAVAAAAVYYSAASTVLLTALSLKPHTLVSETRVSFFCGFTPLPMLTISVVELESPTRRKRKRWAALNSILDKNKKAKTTPDGATSTGYFGLIFIYESLLIVISNYSYVSWEDIRSVYEPIMCEMTVQPKEFPAEDLESLYKYLCRATPPPGTTHSGKEAKRLHFVAPILIHLDGLFNDTMRILIEERILGKNIHTDGNFEFVVQMGGKKMCIIEAKKDDMEQGMAQDLLGCEAVADTEPSECVLGIVTNYLQWSFFKSHEDYIEQEDTTLPIESGKLTKEGLKMIAGKIYSLLSDG
jgi:hypothetical protein